MLNEAPRRGDDIDLLCEAGKEGWELVAILANHVAYLKREVIAPAPEVAEHRRDETEQAITAAVEKTAANGGSSSHVKPKYRNAVTGETWSGRGRMATWLKRKQDAGEDIEDHGSWEFASANLAKSQRFVRHCRSLDRVCGA